MNTMLFRLTIVAVVFCSASTSYGQSSDWYVAPAVVYSDDDPDRAIDDSVAGAQFAVGRNITQHLSLEGLLGYSDIQGYVSVNESYPDQTHLDVSANLLAFSDRDRTFAPYLLVGIGYLGVSYSTGGDENRPSATLGAGFKWKMGQSRISIRGEYRTRLAWEQGNNFNDNIASLGVQFNFGGQKSEPASQGDTDSDGDGVLDYWDHCPNTTRGTKVDSNGCPLRDRQGDADGDRVMDGTDECPNTPVGEAVDRVGCSLDSDHDGVPTGQDRCPASRAGAVVDQYGCDRDDDVDGVRDHVDRCLNTKRGVRVDVYGCEIKDIIRLPGVNFETGSDRLLVGTESLVEDAARTLKNHSDLQIEVAGHTDSVGSGDANYGLSARRAKTVRNFLIRYGVDASRMTAVGYGEAQPISDNETAQGRAANRRVELRIVNR